MPPKQNNAFQVSNEAQIEVVCPLKNADGTACRKRCLGEKRYRSMQEHIRRAHPDYYMPKLPATEESFLLMVNTPPHERPPKEQQEQQPSHLHHAATSGGFPETNGMWYNPGVDHGSGYGTDMNSYYNEDYSHQYIDQSGRSSDEFRRPSLIPAANAAAALAQLHNFRPDVGWESEQDLFPDIDKSNQKPRAHFAPIPVDPQMFVNETQRHPSPPPEPTQLLPSALDDRSPPGRSSTLPPVPRPHKPNRPRKASVAENARRPKHERQRSRDHARRLSYDRKATSAEPHALLQGRRWEDLIDAAASATEEDSRDLTPIPASPQPNNARASLPPFHASHFHPYTASPLTRNLTPPPPNTAHSLEAFPSVESSIQSIESTGSNFHIPGSGLSESSPPFIHNNISATTSPSSSQNVQIYCAGCKKLTLLRDAYACCECICGICIECVNALISEIQRGRMIRCPKCENMGVRFKQFNLELR